MGSFANSGQTPLSVSQVALSESAKRKVKPTRLHFPIIVVAKTVFMFSTLGRVVGPSLSTPRGQPLFIIHALIYQHSNSAPLIYQRALGMPINGK